MSATITLLDYVAASPSQAARGIAQQLVGESVFMRILRLIQADGFRYDYAKQAEMPDIAFRGLNEQYIGDAGALSPEAETLAIFGGTVSTDNLLQGSPAHVNAITQKTRNIGLTYDYYAINGDPSVAGQEKQFYGLKKRLVGAQLIGTGDSWPDGHQVTPKMMDQLLDAVVGPDEQKVIVMSRYQRRQLKDELLGYAGASVSENPIKYNGAVIAVVDEPGAETTILPQTETYGDSTDTGSIYCIRPATEADPEASYVAGLIKRNLPIHTALAQVGTTVSDLVETVMGLALFNGKAAARLRGLK